MTTHEHWTAPKPPADNPDARLLELYGEVRKLLDECGLSDEVGDERSDDAIELEFEIAKLPAYTPAGMLAKAMIASDNILPGERQCSDEANLYSLIADLERMAAA